MTAFRLNDYNKWVHQNNGEVIDLVDGALIDSVLINCKHGVAALFETYMNEWSSCYTVYFGRSGSDDVETVLNMWDTFAGCDVVETA